MEDYTRVSVISTGDTGLAGPAVGDVIHMIAELVENATIYSPLTRVVDAAQEQRA